MQELLNAYIFDATPFAMAHAVFVVVCAALWFHEARLVRREKLGYRAIQTRQIPKLHGSATTQVEILAAAAMSIAQKGSPPDAQMLEKRLLNSLSATDSTLHTLINGLIIIGLLGTLYNLWRLGPAFWSSIIEGVATQQNRSTIGVAFAASFFGLLWALLLTIADHAIFRRRRAIFVRQATEWIITKSADLLPQTSEAAIAKALDGFIQSSEAIMNAASNQQRALASGLASQVEVSSKALETHLTAIAADWGTFLADARDGVKEAGKATRTSAKQLASAINQASQSLTEATKTIKDLRDLGDIVSEIRSESASLISTVTGRMQDLSERTEGAISSAVQQHAKALESESEAANRRLSDLADAWQTNIAGTLNGFSVTVATVSDSLSSNSRETATAVQSAVAQLLQAWQSSLEALVAQTKDALALIHENITGAETLSASLLAAAGDLTRVTEDLSRSLPEQPHRLFTTLNSKLDALGQESRQHMRDLRGRIDALPNRQEPSERYWLTRPAIADSKMATPTVGAPHDGSKLGDPAGSLPPPTGTLPANNPVNEKRRTLLRRLFHQ